MSGEPDDGLDTPGALRPGRAEPGTRRWGRVLPVVVGATVLAAFVGLLVGVTASRGGTARETATQFMVKLRDADYGEAFGMLCEDARDSFPDGAALRDGLGFSGLLISDFEVGEAIEIDEGTNRINVELTLRNGEHARLGITVVQVGGRYLICGF